MVKRYGRHRHSSRTACDCYLAGCGFAAGISRNRGLAISQALNLGLSVINGAHRKNLRFVTFPFNIHFCAGRFHDRRQHLLLIYGKGYGRRINDQAFNCCISTATTVFIGLTDNNTARGHNFSGLGLN